MDTWHTRSSGGPGLYLDGGGCGTCYLLDNGGDQITVMIYDSCPKCEWDQFDIVDSPWGGENPQVSYTPVDC